MSVTVPLARDATVGVALPIPEPWGAQLQQARIGAGDARASVIPTHVTLMPPTPVPHADLESFLEHLEAVAASATAFEVMLRGTGTFRPVSQVVYVAVVSGSQECAALEAAVRAGPVERHLDFPYHPHVTVGHDLRPEQLDAVFTQLADFDCAFTARHFTAYAHHGDGVWQELRRFPLQSRPPEAGSVEAGSVSR